MPADRPNPPTPAPRPASATRFEVLVGDEAPASIERSQWLALERTGATPFSSREWLDCWASKTRPYFEDCLALRCPTGNGEVVTWLFATMTNRQGVRTARLAGTWASEEMGPIGPVGSHLEAGRQLMAAIGSRSLPVDAVILDQLRGDIDWQAVFGRKPVKDTSNVYLDLRGRSFDSWLYEEGRRANRYRVRHRKLEAAGGEVRRFTEGPEAIEAFEATMALHDLRHGAPSGESARAREIHREFVPVAAERGWLRIWTAEVDSRTIAAMYGISFGGTTYLLSTAREADPRWRRISVGTLLLTETIRDAFSEGNDEVALMHFFYEYKSRFSDRDRRVQSHWLPVTAKGRALVAAKRAKRALSRADRPV